LSVITIHQPNYMPWPGFFHKWLLADTFVLLDTVQYHKNEWQNRNRIKTAQGERWITVPVTYRFPQRICEVGIAQQPWAKKQISSIELAYAKSPYLDTYWQPIKQILQQKHQHLASLNIALIRTLGDMLGCTAPLKIASQLPIREDEPSKRLIAMTRYLRGDTYLSGAEGRHYLNTQAFAQAGVSLMFQVCRPPTYPQMHGNFIPYLSVLDVLLNIGEDAKDLIANMGEMQP